MPSDSHHNRVLQVFGAGAGAGGGELSSFFSTKKRKGLAGSEGVAISVLDSPPTSSSTLSSSFGASSDTAGVAAVSDNSRGSHQWPPPGREDWASELQELQPISSDPAADKCVVEDWEAMLSAPATSPTQEQTFLQWIMDDPAHPGAVRQHHGVIEYDGNGNNNPGFGAVDPGFVINPIAHMGGGATSAVNGQFGFPGGGFHQQQPMGVHYEQPLEDKPFLFGMNNHQSHPPPNPAFFLPATSPFAVVEPTCQVPQFLNPTNQYHLQQRQMKPKASAGGEDPGAQQQQALVDQLFKAAELIEAGNPVSARGILARLNHQLPSPVGKPLHRSAFYFKEALQQITDNNSSSTHHHRPPATPLDVVLKLGTYKAFSEVSPVLQFTNFTCIQALLEELGGSDHIHIIDFEIGVGGHWSSFMQELAQHRGSGGTSPYLKITAFASASLQHPLELYLTRENLTQFARDLNIPFEFNVLSLDPFDPSLLLSMCAGPEEAVAVNLPVGCAFQPPVSTLLRVVKQLSPKIVVSVDHGCDRSDLSFSHQFLHAFQACTVLLDSIDAAGTNLDVANKIERFMLQPRIENALMGRHAAGEKTLPWRALFASAGFAPLQFSNFAETQAECLLKRLQVRGFHVEKRHSSLFLCWQRGELVSVSAWRC